MTKEKVEKVLLAIPMLKRFAHKTCRDHDIAEDLVSETVEFVLGNLDRINVASGVRGYLCGVLRMKFLRHKNAKEIVASSFVSMVDGEDEWEPLDWLSGGILPSQINFVAAREQIRWIELLPCRQKNIMILLCEGLNPLEISAETGLAVNTVLAIIRESRDMLETWLCDPNDLGSAGDPIRSGRLQP